MRLAGDAAHQFGGIELDRSKPLRFRLNGRDIEGFAGDTVLSAVLAAGIDTYGTLGEQPIALTEYFCPRVATKGGQPLPMDRLPSTDDLDLTSVGVRRNVRFRAPPNSLQHRLEQLPDPGWQHVAAETTLTADLLIIGGGIAGLAAAEAATTAGRSVILAERRPWLGGDARYFGGVGDEESPEALSDRLLATLRLRDSFTPLTRAEVFAVHSHGATLHQIVTGEPTPRGRVVTIAAKRILIATGATQRLPVFPGNRLPGVQTAIAAYHLAKRYGVSAGPSAVIATQNNYAYRMALRLHDADVAVRRVVDTRIHPQSRFVDFAKASGLTLASGQFPLLATPGQFAFANNGSAAATATIEASQLIVAGAWQPDLALWMLAGGNVRWDRERSALVATGHLGSVALAGSAAGYRSMLACAESGRVAQAALFGEPHKPVMDTEAGTDLETPDSPTPIAPIAAETPSFLSTGSSLATRTPGADTHAFSLGDVAAAVELEMIVPGDAGAIAEERGAPGGDLTASSWTPPTAPASAALPPYLAHRFGDAPERVHLIVDQHRRFAIGALVYSNATRPDPTVAIGVIIETADAGGIALIAKAALATNDRFIVETTAGPSPARRKPD
jgi:sarcosine oxidase subunit alpha